MKRIFPLAAMPAQKGQGGLLVVAITVLIALVIVGASLVGLSQMNAKRTVLTRQSLQTYYVAQGGVQEALANRLLPRSNYYNFKAPTAPATRYFNSSGRVFRNPANLSELIGVYRYLVVGGDAARMPNGNYFPESTTVTVNNIAIPRLINTESIPDTSPFYIISNGMTCRGNNNTTLINAITQSENPTCPGGKAPEELTVVAEVSLDNDNPNIKDRILRQWVFRDRSQVRLPAATFVPGQNGGWTNRVNFDDAWSGTNASQNSPAVPKLLVFYDFVENTIIGKPVQINGPNTDVNSFKVPPRSVIRLYFDGPVDYRSFYKYNMSTLPAAKGCLTDATKCSLRVYETANPANVYGGNTIVPILPASTQVLLLPPFKGTINNTMKYTLEIDGLGKNGVRAFSGTEAPESTYKINFETQ